MKFGVLIFGILFIAVGFLLHNSLPAEADFDCPALEEHGYLSLLDPGIEQGCKNLRLKYFSFGLMGMGVLLSIFGFVLERK